MTRARRPVEAARTAVHAWDAIATCLSGNIALPAWARDYLLGVAREITRLSRDRIPAKGAIDRAVAAAAKLQGGPKFNPFTAGTQDAHETLIAFEVYTRHTANWWNQRKGLGATHDWSTVFRDVAEAHHCDNCGEKQVSQATVKRYWYKHQLEVIPPHLFERAKSHKVDDILR